MSFNHQEIEKKWQKKWDDTRSGIVSESTNKKDSLYYLIMFPYPSGSGLHVGHVESYAAIDILARYQRMKGKNVMVPIGYDSFGLPAENYAIKTGVHPSKTTKTAINTFRQQMKSVGLAFDWDREISTSDPEYYKWTQWLFLLFYKNGLAYRKKSAVNWCNSCSTVLANEQVVAGCCERCKSEVVQKDLEQWFFKTTKYTEDLLSGLDDLDWPSKIKAMQKNWIGKSEGTNIKFKIKNSKSQVEVFTTRPDTIFGATYIVLAPENPLVDEIVLKEHKEEISKYTKNAQKKSALERTELQKIKTGVFTGSYVINPVNNEEIPVWVADYVMMGYGTGAIMAVPAHDERDFEFAEKYSLEIRKVVKSDDDTKERCFSKDGISLNSDFLNGLKTSDAKKKIIKWLSEKEAGDSMTTYRIRDWLVSRQRYWGAPIPIIWCDKCGDVPVEEENLPVLLPEDVDFKPTGESPLVGSKTFHDVKCPKCGNDARRESDTIDTFVDSSWYHLRYCDPKNKKVFADKSKIDYWCPVDLYIGGAEHAVMHLLYARFFAHALNDLGYIKFKEPFTKLRNQGLILGPDGEKMSKSSGNVVNPDTIVLEYGADAIRIYEMFMGPLEDEKPWDIKGVVGIRRFLDRAWKVRSKINKTESDELDKLMHKTIKKVGDDFEVLKFNTAISQLMIMTNAMMEAESVTKKTYQSFIKLLAPLAPHLAEEVWEELGNTKSVFSDGWPTYDKDKLVDETITLAIQINGKMRATIIISPNASKDEARLIALDDEKINSYIKGKDLKEIIYVPGRIMNIVVK